MEAEEIQALIEASNQTPTMNQVAGARQGLTLRERWRRTMFFQSCPCRPNFEFGYWAETLREWHRQGLPPEVNDQASAYHYFGIENWQSVWGDGGLRPAFPREILAEDDQALTYRDPDTGSIAQINKHGNRSIPHFLDFALKDRATWRDFQARLQWTDERLPAWARDSRMSAVADLYRQRDFPLAVGIGSLMGKPRNWIGFEGIALMQYDDPDLLEEIIETQCQISLRSLEPLVREIEFDFGSGWEDICFNSGPILSKDFIQAVVVPRYQRITSLLRQHGCAVCWTDCDGNITPIVDSFLAGGINCMFPVEVHGGSDPVALRQRHPGLRFQGGVDKMILLKGRAAVRREIERLRPVVEEGGFLPGIDHRVQADASLDSYQYYLKLKRDLLGCGGTPQYDERLV